MARRVLAITLVGTSLLVAACGSDDDSSDPSRTGAGATDGSASQSPGTANDRAGDGKGDSGGNGSPGAGNDSSASDGSAGRRASPRKGGSRGKDGSRGADERQPGFSAPGLTPGPPGASPDAGESAPPLARSDAAAHRLAREICANVTLEGIALNLRISLEQRDAEFVARAFSRRYPRDHRDAAYRGCLEGFRNPVKRP